MRLRHGADVRTLLCALLLMPALTVVQFAWPSAIGTLVPLQLYFGFVAGVIAHNHNHCPTFVDRRANALFSAWLSIWYGVPIFGWIPTHNDNHHRYVNGQGDDTITWRYARENSLLSLLSYFFVSNYFQAPSVRRFVADARARRPRLYREIVLQWTAIACAHLTLLAAALALHGVGRGLFVYGVAFLAQVAFAWWSMFFINFVQHVDCDPASRHDHSRNFVGKLGNFLTWNAGYHTAHHEQPGLHWTRLPALHAALAPHIDPRLNEPSLIGFAVRNYVVAPFAPNLRTQLIGKPPW
jgi:beta-carotene hydroxylase